MDGGMVTMEVNSIMLMLDCFPPPFFYLIKI